MSWTPQEIPKLDGKIAVISGANSGIGYYTALELAKHKAIVYLACRSKEKATQAIADLLIDCPSGQFIFIELDVANQKSIDACSKELISKVDHLDILINNAGIMDTPTLQKTVDGFEAQMGTNHFGSFALTAKLMSLLLKSTQPRVVTVSSFLAKQANFTIESLAYTVENYNAKVAYANSKAANQLFAYELHNRASSANSNLLSIAVHPGWSQTNLFRERKSLKGLLTQIATKLKAQSAQQGAWPSLYAATSPDIKSGQFYGPNGKNEYKGHPIQLQPPVFVQNKQFQSDFFDYSQQQTNTQFQF